MYMYTQTTNVSSIAAKNGPKIAVCALAIPLSKSQSSTTNGAATSRRPTAQSQIQLSEK